MNEASKPSRKAEYGSDIIVDLMKAYNIEYVTLNPGATFSGLQDSLVNYGGNETPEVITCLHEEIAVALAHGYAKAKGEPIVAILHDVVGLLHGSMAIFNAWCDMVPIIILGGTGPMDTSKRRPWIDWIHTALIQGNLVREYVKWDDQPASLESIPESFIRAYRVAMTEPQGPVYICYDVALQGEKLSTPIPIPDIKRYAPPSSIHGDPAFLKKVGRMLIDAENPVIIADRVGRKPKAMQHLTHFVESMALPVINLLTSLNIPNNHPMDLSGTDILNDADVILALDVKDLFGALTKTDKATRTSRYVIPDDTKIISINVTDIYIRSTITDFQKLHQVDLSIAADTCFAIPELNKICLNLIEKNPREKIRIKERFEQNKAKHEAQKRKWWETVKKDWGKKPISYLQLAAEIWDVIKDEDWVVAGGKIGYDRWERRLWDFTKAYQYPGAHSGGGGLGYGMPSSLGVALANKNTGRLCVNLQPDGEFLYTSSSLWTAAHYKIPLLVVILNNKVYFNDWDHSYLMSKSRGRPTETCCIGNAIDDPPVHFKRLAESFGLYGDGPIEDPRELKSALQRALNVVKNEKRLALVDVLTQPR